MMVIGERRWNRDRPHGVLILQLPLTCVDIDGYNQTGRYGRAFPHQIVQKCDRHASNFWSFHFRC